MFGKRPKALLCYICGRQYGTTSLKIHIKACEKKWQTQQINKPPRQRRPCPRPPPGFQDLINGKKPLQQKDLQRFNQQSNDNYRSQSLVQCQYCGRKFKPESLIKHQKLCAKDPNTFKRGPSKIQQQKIKSSKGYNLNKAMQQDTNQHVKLVVCSKCGRNFAQERIQKHNKVCKGIGIKQAKQIKPIISNKKVKKQQKPLWKIQHEEFVQAMKQMRLVKKVQKQGGDIRSIPVKKGNYDHYVLCEYCGRKYAPDVAERHIPKCANIVNKPSGIKASQIGQKYIKGTGVGQIKTKPKQSPLISNSKKSNINPNFGKVMKK